MKLKDGMKVLTTLDMKMLRGGSRWCECLNTGKGTFLEYCVLCSEFCYLLSRV